MIASKLLLLCVQGTFINVLLPKNERHQLTRGLYQRREVYKFKIEKQYLIDLQFFTAPQHLRSVFQEKMEYFSGKIGFKCKTIQTCIDDRQNSSKTSTKNMMKCDEKHHACDFNKIDAESNRQTILKL